jgi:membrane protease YdiL (CAAX protease family)
MRQWSHFALLLTGLAVFFAWYAAIELRRYPIGPLPAAAIYLSMILLFALYLVPGFSVLRERVSRRVRGIPGACVSIGAFLLPYLFYAAGTGDFRWTAGIRLFAFAALPFGLFAALPVRDSGRLNWQDIVVLLWLFVPVVFGRIGGIWNVPVNLDFVTRVFLVAVGAWAFLIIRGIEHSGYEFRFTPGVLRDALESLAWYAVIAIPVGFAMRFLAWHPQWRGLASFARDYVTIFLFVAIAEELFFRGLLQNLLEGSLGSRWLAQGVAAILFGLTHIRHAPFPNWRYVILATIAGWFYGGAYRKHRSLMAAATTHALVDTIWRTWFTLPQI